MEILLPSKPFPFGESLGRYPRKLSFRIKSMEVYFVNIINLPLPIPIDEPVWAWEGRKDALKYGQQRSARPEPRLEKKMDED
jgi:hypothetical protein